MLESDGTKKSSNWMRDQWVANLKKKRMQQAAAGVNGGDGAVSKSDSRPHTASGSTNTRGRNNQRNQRNQQNTLQSSASMNNMMSNQFNDKEMGLVYPAMFLNDLGCFEIESQSFTRLTPTRDRGGRFLDDLGSASSSPSGSDKPAGKKWGKTLVKKRCSTLDVNQPKPRTPRRKLNCGIAFEDIDSPSSASSHSYSSVGTPSNFSAEITRMWGPEVDFTANSYVDTFLDLPTPKSAEIPTISSSSFQSPYSANIPSDRSEKTSSGLHRDLEQPKLIRTTSIEQEGLSHVFEHTHLDTSLKASLPGSDYTKAIKPTPENRLSMQSMGESSRYPPSTWGAHNGSQMGQGALPSSSLQLPTPRGVSQRTGREVHMDHKNMPEFETLLEEYKFNDIDQELDSFYLETIESLGGEFDLIS